jgi:hypothetical protein
VTNNDHAPPSTSAVPNRLLARWQATRVRARAAGTWVASTLVPDPVAAHAARARTLSPNAWERHLRRRGVDRH